MPEPNSMANHDIVLNSGLEPSGPSTMLPYRPKAIQKLKTTDVYKRQVPLYELALHGKPTVLGGQILLGLKEAALRQQRHMAEGA